MLKCSWKSYIFVLNALNIFFLISHFKNSSFGSNLLSFKLKTLLFWDHAVLCYFTKKFMWSLLSLMPLKIFSIVKYLKYQFYLMNWMCKSETKADLVLSIRSADIWLSWKKTFKGFCLNVNFSIIYCFWSVIFKLIIVLHLFTQKLFL